jgi:hypothetical protein
VEKIITRVPPSEFCCYSLSALTLSGCGVRAREDESRAPSFYICMCVYFSFFSISHQSGCTFLGCCTYILFCARRAHLVVVISPVIYGAIYLYPRRTSAVVFRTLSPRRKYGRGVGKKAREPAWICKEIIEVFNDFPPRLQTANFGVQFHHSDLFGQRYINKSYPGGVNTFFYVSGKIIKTRDGLDQKAFCSSQMKRPHP